MSIAFAALELAGEATFASFVAQVVKMNKFCDGSFGFRSFEGFF